jgi:hypothetical protein
MNYKKGFVENSEDDWSEIIPEDQLSYNYLSGISNEEDLVLENSNSN